MRCAPLLSFFLFLGKMNLFMFQCLKANRIFPPQHFELELQQGLTERGRLMKRKEDLFSRQQFICVCVFVPPSSVLQISQLCEELKGVESTLSVPISSLRFVPPIHTPTHAHAHKSASLVLSHFVLFTRSPSLSSSLTLLSHLSLPLSRDSFLALNTPFSLNCEHHNRTNDVPLLCHISALCPLVLCQGSGPVWRVFGGGGWGRRASFCAQGCG